MHRSLHKFDFDRCPLKSCAALIYVNAEHAIWLQAQIVVPWSIFFSSFFSTLKIRKLEQYCNVQFIQSGQGYEIVSSKWKIKIIYVYIYIYIVNLKCENAFSFQKIKKWYSDILFNFVPFFQCNVQFFFFVKIENNVPTCNAFFWLYTASCDDSIFN